MRPVEADLSSSGVPERPCASKGSLSGPVRPVSAQTKADWDLYSLHGGDQRADTQDVHDPFEIVAISVATFLSVLIWKWVARQLFAEILRPIDGLWPKPAPTRHCVSSLRG